MNPTRLPFLAVASLALAFGASCGSQEGDPPSPSAVPPPAGKDRRIAEIRDPESPYKAAHEASVAVSGAVVVAVDRFDETGNGRSAGTIYVADLGSQAPFSGIRSMRFTNAVGKNSKTLSNWKRSTRSQSIG